jgi:hypothetical protein
MAPVAVSHLCGSGAAASVRQESNFRRVGIRFPARTLRSARGIDSPYTNRPTFGSEGRSASKADGLDRTGLPTG